MKKKIITTQSEFLEIAELSGISPAKISEINKIADYLDSQHVPYSIFTECDEGGWYLVSGIRHTNSTDYWILKGEYEIPNGFIEK